MEKTPAQNYYDAARRTKAAWRSYCKSPSRDAWNKYLNACSREHDALRKLEQSKRR